MSRQAVPVAAVLLAAVALSAILFGSPLEALENAFALAIFTLPGYPVAKRYFEGAVSILVGAAIGYFASALAASLLFRLGYFEPVAVGVAPVLLYVVARVVWPPRSASAPDRNEGTNPWLAVALASVLVLVAAPFARVGASVPGGTAYRAYFSADLMTHLSVVAELQKGVFPPQNPFYAGEPLDYYWLVFTFPAAIGALTSNQGALLSLYLASGLLFAGLLFCAMRELGLRPARACLATLVALFAASYDGLLALVAREPWTGMNVDAFSRWAFELVSLDGLHRSILYTPQHLFSYSLLLILLMLVWRPLPDDAASAGLSGVLLGGMAGASIVTAMLAGPWLVLRLFWRRASSRRFVGLATLSTVSALAFLGWYVALGFFGSAGGALILRAPRLMELPSLLVIDAGALVGLVLFRLRRPLESRDRELMALGGLAIVATLFLDLAGYEGIWMAWRAGSVLLVALALLAAPALEGRLGVRQALLLLPALLTVFLDVYNAQDTTNRELSPGGFRWTTTLSDDEAEAFAWLRQETPPASVVQWDTRARDLGSWAFLPALAERRMAAGFPIFLLDVGKYRVRERRHVRPIFVSGDAEEAYRQARELGIDYLFVGATEIETRGERVRALFEAPQRFRSVFENASVTILAVVPG